MKCGPLRGWRPRPLSFLLANELQLAASVHVPPCDLRELVNGLVGVATFFDRQSVHLDEPASLHEHWVANNAAFVANRSG